MSHVRRDRRFKHLEAQRVRNWKKFDADWLRFRARWSWFDRLLWRLFRRVPSGWWREDVP